MLTRCAWILPLLALLPAGAWGQTLFLSTADDAGNTLGGLTFADGDVIAYDTVADSAMPFFAETSISPDGDVDAFHRLPDGSLLLSTRLSGRTLGTLTFNDGDLVRYVPGTNSASIYFLDESDFAVSADIDAVSIDANGDIVLSTLEDNTLGGLAYTGGDIIVYDPDTQTASLLVAEATLFDDGDGDVTGVHVLEDGTLLITFAAASETISGTAFVSGDIVHYDPVADTATLQFSAANFTDANSHAVDAVYYVAAAQPAGYVLYFSDNNNVGNQLAGLIFNDGDIVRYDTDANTAGIFFAESNITPNADVDAFHLLPDGSMLLSVLFNGRTLGGLTFDDGDLVRYDPMTNTASIYVLSEASFGTGADINAVTLAPDGDIILSNRENNSIGALSYDDGDIVRYDIDTGTASIMVPQAAIFDDGDGDVSSLHLLPDGTFLLSFTDTTEMISGVVFNDGDIIHYDPVADTAEAVFTELQFEDGSTSHEIDAVYAEIAFVPGPGDCDGDGDVDLDDHAGFVNCLAGPDQAPPGGCSCFDLDEDGDNDLADFALFTQGFTR
ncbi:MAG TPA: hypothetical protein P5572_15760 [Phycisphaerae bacterium]|nr:hypothetical protein [Phycisphaerae bacterium]